MTDAKERVRVVHLSDLHCYRLTFSLLQFFSKRWLGNFNLLFNRHCDFYADPHASLLPFLTQLKADHVLISGDLTMTSRIDEFEAAKKFVKSVEESGIQVHTVPGNHDNYTRSAYKKQLFYRYFGDESLKNQGVTVGRLSRHWWWVGLDTSLATHLIASTGLFSEKLEKPLHDALQVPPSDANILIVNHFPLFSNRWRHRLLQADALRHILRQHGHVRLYLHGHIHQQVLDDRRDEGLPLILNSGSCGMSKGRASCSLLELEPNGCLIETYRHSAQERWERTKKQRFNWNPYS